MGNLHQMEETAENHRTSLFRPHGPPAGLQRPRFRKGHERGTAARSSVRLNVKALTQAVIRRGVNSVTGEQSGNDR